MMYIHVNKHHHRCRKEEQSSSTPDDKKNYKKTHVSWGRMGKRLSLVELWPLNAAVSKWKPPAGFIGPYCIWILGWVDYLIKHSTDRIQDRRSTFYWQTGLWNQSLVYSIFFHALSLPVKTFISTVRAPGLDARDANATGAFQDRKGVDLLSWDFNK